MFGTIRNRQKEKLDYSYHAGDPKSDLIAVLGHGVTGNKDRPFIAALAEGFSEAGIHALRFSFAGNGASEGRFEDAVITKEVDDLGSVLDALKGRAICYIGHSMGAAVGVLRASTDRRIAYLVSLAGMVDTRNFALREFGEVTPDKGFMWDNPACPLSSAYMNDLIAIDTVVARAAQIAAPWLLVHGLEDDVVPIQDARDIFERANPPRHLVEMPGGDHVFSGPAAPRMVETVVTWLKTQSGE